MYITKKHPADSERYQQDVFSPNVSIRMSQFNYIDLRRKSQSIFAFVKYFYCNPKERNNEMKNKCLIGSKKYFAIEFSFYDETHETELAVFVNGENILAFERNETILTTRWNLDELALWLREFIDHMTDDPYPVNCDGMYAAMKDENARDFDSDDDDVFEAYYQKLYDWNLHHRWHPASSGAILSNVYFQKVGEFVEVSWNNKDAENGVRFLNEQGGSSIDEEAFVSTINAFLKEYALHWFK